MADDSRWWPGKPLRIIPVGDADAANEWIPFARRKMVELSRFGDYARRTWYPADGVVIRGEMLSGIPRVFIEVGGYEYITIGDYFSGDSSVRGIHAGKFGQQNTSKKINDWLNRDWTSFGRVDGYLVGKNLLPLGGGVFLTDRNVDESAPFYCAVVSIIGMNAAIKLLARPYSAMYPTIAAFNANYGGRRNFQNSVVLPVYEYCGYAGAAEPIVISNPTVGSHSGINTSESTPSPYIMRPHAVTYTSTAPLGTSISVSGFSGNVGPGPVPMYETGHPVKDAFYWADTFGGIDLDTPSQWEPTGNSIVVDDGTPDERTFYEFKLTSAAIANAVARISVADRAAMFFIGPRLDPLWLPSAPAQNWRTGFAVSVEAEHISSSGVEPQDGTTVLATDTIAISVRIIETLRYISRDPQYEVSTSFENVAAAIGAIRYHSGDPAIFLWETGPFNYAGPVIDFPPVGMGISGEYMDSTRMPGLTHKIYRLSPIGYDSDGRYSITVPGAPSPPVSARVSSNDIALLCNTSGQSASRKIHNADVFGNIYGQFYNSPPSYTPDYSNTNTIISITSNDSGLSWHANVMEMPENRPSFTCLTYVGNDTLLAMASVSGGGEAWRSTDKGVTYSPCNTSIALNFSPTYMVCMDTGVAGFYDWDSPTATFWRTVDFGTTWQAFSIPVIDPEHPELGGGYEYPFVQFNNRVTIVSKGETYETTTLALTIWHPIPDNPFVRETRVFLSKDGGETWHEDAKLQAQLWGANIGPVHPNVKANCGVPGYLDPPP